MAAQEALQALEREKQLPHPAFDGRALSELATLPPPAQVESDTRCQPAAAGFAAHWAPLEFISLEFISL